MVLCCLSVERQGADNIERNRNIHFTQWNFTKVCIGYQLKIVEIKWGDAWVDADDFSLDNAKKLKPIVRTTVGFLITENSEVVVLCTDFYEEDKKTINTPMVIPRNMIIDYWVYEVVNDQIQNK